MTTLSARVIADSIGSDAKRLTTLLLRYPRFIHSEVMTHRVFSRNASSSRAIPVERLIREAIDDPAVPLYWGRNRPGMQAREECDSPVVLPIDGSTPVSRECAWLEARDRAVEYARAFSEAGYHKQVVNRLLEPFVHIRLVVTSTQWSNFFELRCHEDAEPHFRDLAREIARAMSASVPTRLEPGEWHLPFIGVEDRENAAEWTDGDLAAAGMTERVEVLVRASAARCARTSYMTHDGTTPTIEADLALYDRLVGSRPMHASPIEHQATPWRGEHVHGHLCGNLVGGWVQYRKMVEHGVSVRDLRLTS